MKTIQFGDRGIEVRILQCFLHIEEDGEFGRDTQSALNEWKEKNKLSKNGIMENSDWKIVANQMPEIQFGDVNDAVKVWQLFIGVENDGDFGLLTLTPTREYQKENNLNSDGIVGKETWMYALTHFPYGQYDKNGIKLKRIADISHWNEDINWDLAREELDFVIFRASAGFIKDRKYIYNTTNCGLPYGVYHYVKASNAKEAKEEAQFFLNIIKETNTSPLFYIADVEYEAQNASNTEEVCVTFLQELRDQGCERIGLYINGWYKWAGKAINMCDIMWIPHWGWDNGNVPDESYRSPHYCDIWQYTSKGTINGIKTDVDLNILIGNKDLNWFLNKKEEKIMAEKFTNVHFVEFCKKFVGMPYWYGTCVYPCTSSLLNSKSRQYPEHYTSDRMNKYRQAINDHKICADCVGLIKGYGWTNGGEGVIESIGKSEPLFKSSYATHGMPDQSANGMFEYAQRKGLDWGSIDTILEIPGIAVRLNGHVGVYIGNGKVIEEKGFAYGCVETNLKDSKWLHWYKIPGITYITGEGIDSEMKEIKLGDRLLRRGNIGKDVKELQKLLNELLNLKLDEDGEFGNNTEQAVEKFQARYGLSVDGQYGPQSHAKLMSLIGDRNQDAVPKEPEPEPSIIPTKPEESKKEVKTLTTTGNVYIRLGDSTSYDIITSVASGTQLIPIFDKNNNLIISSNDWYAVKCVEQIGWVSGKYIK